MITQNCLLPCVYVAPLPSPCICPAKWYLLEKAEDPVFFVHCAALGLCCYQNKFAQRQFLCAALLHNVSHHRGSPSVLWITESENHRSQCTSPGFRRLWNEDNSTDELFFSPIQLLKSMGSQHPWMLIFKSSTKDVPTLSLSLLGIQGIDTSLRHKSIS